MESILAVFLLVLLLFAVKPKQAHIYMNIENGELPQKYTSRISIQAEKAECSGFSKELLAIDTNNDVCEIIVSGYITVNGSYHPGEYLVLHATKKESPDQCMGIVLFGECNKIRLSSDVDINIGSDLSILSAKEMVINFTRPLNFRALNAEVYIENPSDNTKNRKVDLEMDKILVGNNQSSVYIHINENSTGKLFVIDQCTSIESATINEFYGSVSGNATVAYSPTSNDYTLNSQDVYLVNKSSSILSLNFYPLSFEGVLAGYFTEGSISTFSVLPSLESWFFSNGLLAPVSLITVILSAISIFLNRKNKKKE